MQSKAAIESQLEQLKHKFGEWSYDIPLPHGVWTKGNLGIPHTRLKRIVQVVTDLCSKPLSSCRILDLGCLDGLFSIEFASHGAETIGVEIRDANLQKAQFCRDALGLNNLKFVQDDVRNISPDAHGKFDAIICSGILYHLPANDVFKLVETMFEMTTEILVIDTQISMQPLQSFRHKGAEYWGRHAHEHGERETQEQKAKKLWASWDNNQSFYLTRPSLINLLARTGFSSVYECFVPPHINFGKPGIECRDRCTIVAIKKNPKQLVNSPAANQLQEDWPENSLSYPPDHKSWLPVREIISRIKSKLNFR
jgi:2-polyprenyl-3-methyl-5-hydroxy-6-metoxy-1,4-benzoquinol methylase